MFDASLRQYIDPPLNRFGRYLHKIGVTANMVTLFALVPAGLAAYFIIDGQWIAALIAIICNRLCDGLDGAVARNSDLTDRGAYLDIVCDFLFYSIIPLAFAVHNPAENSLAASVLLYSFIGTACSFLGYAIIAAKRDITTDIRGKKGFYYIGGLTEGFETICVFIVMSLLPMHFAVIAYFYAGLCLITTITRMIAAWTNFND